MDFASLFLFVVSTIGMCLIIVDGSIMEKFRALVKTVANTIRIPSLGGVVDCYLCCGTWCGFLMGYVWISKEPLKVFACGCAGAFLSNLAAAILNWIEAATIVNLPSNNNGN
jgi:hypothetical protein